MSNLLSIKFSFHCTALSRSECKLCCCCFFCHSFFFIKSHSFTVCIKRAKSFHCLVLTHVEWSFCFSFVVQFVQSYSFLQYLKRRIHLCSSHKSHTKETFEFGLLKMTEFVKSLSLPVHLNEKVH